MTTRCSDIACEGLEKAKNDLCDLSDQMRQIYFNLEGLHELLATNGRYREWKQCVSTRISLDELPDLDLAAEANATSEFQLTQETMEAEGDIARWASLAAAGGIPTSPRSAGLASSKKIEWFGSPFQSEGSGHRQAQSEHSEDDTSCVASPMAADHPSFALRGVWAEEEAQKRFASKAKERVHKKRRFRGSMVFKSGAEVPSDGPVSQLIMRPNSVKCLAWDVVCTVAIMHDTVMIPLLSSFPIEHEGVPAVLEGCSSLIWLVDVILSFFRGFLNPRKGFVEMRPNEICYQYVTGWFLPDAVMVAIDLVSLSLGEVDGLDTVTLLRLIRSLRILRLLKMTSRLAVLRETMISLDHRMEFSSVYLETAWVVLKQLGIIALLCHFTGCAWYAIGAAMPAGTASWVSQHHNERWHLYDQAVDDWAYMYVTAVHWSLTQFTPAAMDVVAVNGLERTFSVIVTLAGLIVFSFFIGNVNQSLARLRNLTAQEMQQNALVRRYVNEKGISVGLATEILTFIKQRGLGKASSKLVLADIKALQVLPREILTHLLEEVNMPILMTHGLMKYLSMLVYADVARLCEKALKEQSIVHGEEIFHSGSMPDRMFFNTGGRLHYCWEPTPHFPMYVEEGQSISEAVLWLTWEYHGRLSCEEQAAHFFSLDGNAFRKIMSRSELIETAYIYARLFLQLFQDAYATEEEATDLFPAEHEVAEMVRSTKTWQDRQSGAVKVFSQFMTPLGLESAFDIWREATKEARRQRQGVWSWICKRVRAR